MTATEAVARQVAHENLKHLRPETIKCVEDVLQRIETVHTLSHREIGALQWAAFVALTAVQVDLKLF